MITEVTRERELTQKRHINPREKKLKYIFQKNINISVVIKKKTGHGSWEVIF